MVCVYAPVYVMHAYVYPLKNAAGKTKNEKRKTQFESEQGAGIPRSIVWNPYELEIEIEFKFEFSYDALDFHLPRN